MQNLVSSLSTENKMHSRTPLLIVAKRTCGCPNPKAAQGHIGWGPEKPDLLGSNTAHGRSLELGGH